MSDNPFHPRDPSALPDTLPIFPLSGATLLPGTQLPLNIFEPRYLAMVLDALGRDRAIGMVQPDPRRAHEQPVATYPIGCAGRIVAFNETDDGRLLISLHGVCRFRIGDELPLLRGYRRVRPVWSGFERDLHGEDGFRLEREGFRASVAGYLEANGIRVDWDALDKMPDQRVVDFLAMHLPFSPEEKQALVEAPDVARRAQTLGVIAQMAERADAEAGGTRH